MRIAIAICSVGRPEALAQLLPWLAQQSHRASDVALVVTSADDLPGPAVLAQLPGLQVAYAEKGLPRQRNRALEALLPRCDALFFIDDDYLPARDALTGIARSFAAFPEVAGMTGHLLADGIHTGGLTMADGMARVEHTAVPRVPRALKRQLVGLYGCNMVFRSAAIGAERFDTRLPLYGWQEDVDFAARVPGEMIRTDGFCGVHCGLREGRETGGARLGYSQIANTAYLMRKGSLPRGFALRLMARNLLANHLAAQARTPWIDRRARAAGNRLALRDLLRGPAAPERVLELGLEV